MGKNLSAFFKKTYTLIQIFLFLNVSFFTYAQESSIFETVTENEGLPSNYIFQVVQDENDISGQVQIKVLPNSKTVNGIHSPQMMDCRGIT